MIGRGSFGHVYKAVCKLNQRTYALKQQSKEKIKANNLMKYVLSEQQIIQKLHH